MLKKGILPVILFLITVLAASADAREWTIVGPRALGMGGAGVAVANDASASYWNPAAFGFFKRPEGGDYGSRNWSVMLDAGAGAQVHDDLGEEVNKIAEVNFDVFNNGTISDANAQNVSGFITLVNDLQQFRSDPNRALTITMHGALAAEVSSIGVGGYVFSDVSAKGNLDLVNIGPVAPGTTFTVASFSDPSNLGCSACSTTAGNFSAAATAVYGSNLNSLYSNLQGLGWTQSQATGFINATANGLQAAQANGTTIPSDIAAQVQNLAALGNTAANSGGAFANNNSSLLFRGLVVGELPITYGHTILSDDFAVGANVKFMRGRTYNAVVPVFNTKFQDALSTAKDSYKDSNNFGLDIGALYRFGDSLRVGVVGRNLNSPKFDVKSVDGGDNSAIKESAQVRAGVAYKPWRFLTLALDADLTKNNTTVSDGFKSQNIGGGLEANVFRILQLRAGAYKNIAESDIGFVYTAGLGVNLYVVNIDLGAAVSPQTTKIDNTTIPKEARVELAISSLF